MLRKLSAHYIFPGNAAPIKKGIIVIDENNVIVDLIDTNGNLSEYERMEFFDGIIVPGFVNTHHHLELSHLKGRIEPKTGLTKFLKQIGQLRDTDLDDKPMFDADMLMQQNGIVAVGDISNTERSFTIKRASHIDYFTFIEIFGFHEKAAQKILNSGKELLEKLTTAKLAGSLTPHAPYSLSEKLWDLLTAYSKERNLAWSVHNQECAEENHLFVDKTGELSNFIELISPEFKYWEAPNTSSLQYCTTFYKQIPNVLLVHNTFTSAADLQALEGIDKNIVFVLCPNANLYIEDRLPDIELLRKSGSLIALGTDSLASNTTLSILEEIKTIQYHYPQIDLTELIDWGTINGAKALGIDANLGNIQKGKKPGLNLITNINFKEMKLTSQSEVKVLA